ncbi:MAG: DUF3592 domain-containing protein [Chloroflexaceae bacterium]|nr:DUF3592 domain-containing protein [Chloroflexaceae bacterium]
MTPTAHPNLFVLEPSRAGVARRGRLYIPSMAIFLFCVGLGFTFFGGIGVSRTVQQWQALPNTVERTGVVTTTDTEFADEGPRYLVTFRYSVPDNEGVAREFTGTDEVRGTYFLDYRAGQELPIWVDQTDPANAFLQTPRLAVNWVEQFALGLMVVLGVGVLGMGAWMTWDGLRLTLASKRLIGTVVARDGFEGEDDYMLVLDCRYTDPSGQSQTIRTVTARNDLRNTQEPPLGTPVLILYTDAEHVLVV